ncbi:MAG: hypothetical protein IPI95_08780 [Flavobacteriales bacterium]|nr:hypothetical protein [Flavobacteriales bacterium]
MLPRSKADLALFLHEPLAGGAAITMAANEQRVHPGFQARNVGSPLSPLNRLLQYEPTVVATTFLGDEFL